MTDEYPTRRTMRHAARPPKRRIHPVGWVGIALGTMLIVLVGWIGVRGLIAKNELESALPLVSQIKDNLTSADLAAAQATIETVAEKTATARAMTSDPIWRAAESVPALGDNLRVFRELAQITDEITVDVMVPVASLGDVLNPASLKPVDGKIDVALFERAIPIVESAVDALAASYEDVKAVDTAGTLGAVADAQQRLETMLRPVVPLAEQAKQLVSLLPALLGANEPRNYLLVFQNNSEARSLGGHAGSWAQLSVNDGKIDLSQQSSVFDLKTGGVSVIDIDPTVLSLWSGAGEDPSNVTLVPRLDLSARTAQAFWAHRYGVQADAVIFVDPVALGYFLAATGPIELPTGDIIDAKNGADFLLNGVYLKYPLNADQDLVFDSIAKLMFGAITAGDFDPKALVSAALNAGSQHRLLTWFSREDEQEAFAQLPFALETPLTNDDVATFGVYVTDNLGSKMTYYVDSTVELGQAQCASGATQYQVKVTVTNRVNPADGPSLPTYVANTAQGGLRVLVTLYAPPGSSFVREAAAGWDPTFVTLVGTDGEYPVMTQRVALAPGETLTGTYVLTAPDAKLDRKLQAYVTPLARPIPVTEGDYSC